MQDERPLRLSEAAALVHVNERTIRRWVDVGELQSVTVGKEARYRAGDVLALAGRRKPRQAGKAGGRPHQAGSTQNDAQRSPRVHDLDPPRYLATPQGEVRAPARPGRREPMYWDSEREAARAKVDVLRSRVDEVQAQTKLEELEEQRREKLEHQRREELEEHTQEWQRAQAEQERWEEGRHREAAEMEKQRRRAELLRAIDDVAVRAVPWLWSSQEREALIARIRKTVRREIDAGELLDLDGVAARIRDLVAEHEHSDPNRRAERRRGLIAAARIPIVLDLDEEEEDEERREYIRRGLGNRVGANWSPERVQDLVRELDAEWRDAEDEDEDEEEEDEDEDDEDEEEDDEES